MYLLFNIPFIALYVRVFHNAHSFPKPTLVLGNEWELPLILVSWWKVIEFLGIHRNTAEILFFSSSFF